MTYASPEEFRIFASKDPEVRKLSQKMNVMKFDPVLIEDLVCRQRQ